jgi:hypothetical protein
MRMAVAALVLLAGSAEAQLRSPGLSEASDKARKEFEKRNEKIRQAMVIPTKPSGLAEYKDHPNAARDAIEEACKIAARDSKMVFITSGSPPCGCCVAFHNYHLLDDVNDVLGKHYVMVDINTTFMPDGITVFSKYAKPSMPSWAIISPKKKVVVDSYSPKGNIGYPGTAEGMAYYFAALRKATPAITENELRWLAVQLQKAGDMPNPWKGNRALLRY